MEAQIKALKKLLMAAERVAVMTGAGISAESGVPTYFMDYTFQGKAGEIVLRLVEDWK